MKDNLNIFLNSKINPNYVDFFISERNEIQEYIGELYAYSYLHFLRLKGKYPYSNEERSKLSRNIQNFGNLFDRLDFIFRRDEEFKLFRYLHIITTNKWFLCGVLGNYPKFIDA